MEKQEILLKEYDALRQEILDRSKRENDSLLWSLTLLLALFGSNSFNMEVVSIIPLAFAFFGHIWIQNSFIIFIIGKYIKKNVEQKISELENSKQPIMGWQTFMDKNKLASKIHDTPFFVIPVLYFGLVSTAAISFQGYSLYHVFNTSILISFLINIGILTLYLSYWNKTRISKKLDIKA